jgi:HD-like signal output (HDOD) protein
MARAMPIAFRRTRLSACEQHGNHEEPIDREFRRSTTQPIEGRIVSASPSSTSSDSNGFKFVTMLAGELSSGKVDLPSFPDVAQRVRRALQDEAVTAEKIVRIVGAEPSLTARLLQLANSAAVNMSGKQTTDLRVAIARIGLNLVRSTSITFAMSQLTKSEALRGVREPLRVLWQRSALVAAMASVLAKRLTKVNPDAAALAGMLHGIGKLYILVNAVKFPELFADPESYARIEQLWHADIAKALLENWEMGDDVVAAVHQFEDFEYAHDDKTDLTDVLMIANLMATYREHPEDIELNLQGVGAARRIQLDGASFKKLLAESGTEIEALRSALGT